MALHEVAPFDLSLAVWGYHVAGDATEPTAWLCESRDIPPPMERWRDHDTAWHAGIERHIGDLLDPAPEWWALPAVVDLAVALKQELDARFWSVVYEGGSLG